MTRNKFVSSYRDPSGFIFLNGGNLYRQINQSYAQNYDLLVSSGLYTFLISRKFMVPHKEVNEKFAAKNGYKIIRPQLIPLISYPYEWCFSELKDAAILTLDIQEAALKHGLTTKDASSFNIQFRMGRPIFIDTLSFEKFLARPWFGYKQFCEQFLGPLALMSQKDVRLGGLLLPNVGNIPLDLINHLLPLKSKLDPSLFIHLSLHAESQKKNADRGLTANLKQTKFSLTSALGLVDSLRKAVKSLHWSPPKTIWRDYYEESDRPSYNPRSFKEKKKLVAKWLRLLNPELLLDLGANTGVYSLIADDLNIPTVALDNDPAAVEALYKKVRAESRANVLPLVVDILSPTPSIGWANAEREAFFSRIKPDTILALALIHHLAITGNIPLPMLVDFFATHCQNLVIEFVPKDDPQTQRLLHSREDIFPNFDRNSFEKEFQNKFQIKESVSLTASKRSLYLMTKKSL